MNRHRLVFFLLGKQYHFNMSEYLDFVRTSQYWTVKEIEDYQNLNLKKIIKHAYENVPFYKEYFRKCNIEPEDIQCIADLYKLPVIRKKDVSEHYQKFLAENYKQYHPLERSTGGTTGVAFPFYNDTRAWAINWATKMRLFQWGGYTYGKHELGVLAGGSLLPQNKLSLKNRIWRYLNNYYTMPISHMDDSIMEKYYQELKKRKVRFLRGYPTAVYSFAEYLDKHRKVLPLVSIFTTAEMLLDYHRAVIERVFQCKVFDMYGCGDGMGHACECEKHEGLHINHEASIMQIVDKQGKEVKTGEEGEIVLTSLFDYAMPFIRYAPGDMAIKAEKPCSCGRNMPLIKKIIGRTTDIIKLSNGRIINGLSIPFEVLTRELRQFQIIQTAPDEIKVLLLPKIEFRQNKIDEIKKMMDFHCGQGINISVQIVDEIPLPKSGKFRYVVSEINN